MKKLFTLVILILLPGLSFAQLKQTQQPSIAEMVAKPASNISLGFLNPEKFSMHHQFSMSYMTVGGGGMMLNTYQNSMTYRFSNPVWLNLNLGIMNSPYNSFNNNPVLKENTRFFGGAELNWKPTDNTHLRLGFDVAPGYYYRRYNNTPFGW